MSLLSFIKDAGERLFRTKEIESASSKAASDVAVKANLDQLNAAAGKAISTYIEKQNLGVQALAVTFDGSSGTVKIEGTAPSQEASEKVTLCCVNVSSVSKVENMLTKMRGKPRRSGRGWIAPVRRTAALNPGQKLRIPAIP